MLTVFSFGLSATLDDLLYLVRRPGLLARSLVAMFVVVPLAILAIAWLFPFPLTVEVWLLALSVSALSIGIVPLAVALMGLAFGRPFAMAPSAVAPVMVRIVMLPLLGGMLVLWLAPRVAARLKRPAAVIGGVALAIAAANFPAEQFGPPIILYLLVVTMLTIPYVRWQGSRLGTAVS